MVLANQISNFRLIPHVMKTVKTSKVENFLLNIILLKICLAKKYPEAGSVTLLYLTKHIANRVDYLRIENILILNQTG